MSPPFDLQRSGMIRRGKGKNMIDYDDPRYREKYIDFMYNPENIGHCDKCPENRGFSDWQGCLPCGQQHCWVRVHCGFMADEDD